MNNLPGPRHPWAPFRTGNLWPRDGRCPHSIYRSGAHRVAVIPTVTHLDNGAPGYIAAEMCVECGRRFGSWFVPAAIPSRASWLRRGVTPSVDAILTNPPF